MHLVNIKIIWILNLLLCSCDTKRGQQLGKATPSLPKDRYVIVFWSPSCPRIRPQLLYRSAQVLAAALIFNLKRLFHHAATTPSIRSQFAHTMGAPLRAQGPPTVVASQVRSSPDSNIMLLMVVKGLEPDPFSQWDIL